MYILIIINVYSYTRIRRKEKLLIVINVGIIMIIIFYKNYLIYLIVYLDLKIKL